MAPDSAKFTDAALELQGVSKSFKSAGRTVQALDRVTVAVKGGRVTGLIGPDGAGKTTLMRLVTGLFAPDEGKIAVLGIDALAEPQRVQSAVGYMPQRFGLYEDLSVRQNLDLYADLHAVAPATKLILRTGEAETARWSSDQIGERNQGGHAGWLVVSDKPLLLAGILWLTTDVILRYFPRQQAPSGVSLL
jgi:ABC-type sugar transport system ATPase subunit